MINWFSHISHSLNLLLLIVSDDLVLKIPLSVSLLAHLFKKISVTYYLIDKPSRDCKRISIYTIDAPV